MQVYAGAGRGLRVTLWRHFSGRICPVLKNRRVNCQGRILRGCSVLGRAGLRVDKRLRGLKGSLVFFFFFFLIWLKYSWFTALCLFLLYSKAIQLYANTSILFQILFHIDYHRTMGRVPCVNHRSPLTLPSVYKSVHMPILNPQFIPRLQVFLFFSNYFFLIIWVV